MKTPHEELRGLSEILLALNDKAEEETPGLCGRLVVMLKAELPRILIEVFTAEGWSTSTFYLNTITYFVRNLKPRARPRVEKLRGLGGLIGAVAVELRERPVLNQDLQGKDAGVSYCGHA